MIYCMLSIFPVWLTLVNNYNCCNCKTVSVVCVPGDGNCLLHAVSMYMWGHACYSVHLRQVLHSIMSQGGCRTQLRQRWQRQREWQNTFIPDGGLQYSDEVSVALHLVFLSDFFRLLIDTKNRKKWVTKAIKEYTWRGSTFQTWGQWRLGKLVRSSAALRRV